MIESSEQASSSGGSCSSHVVAICHDHSGATPRADRLPDAAFAVHLPASRIGRVIQKPS
jgi:hypothetical protein